MNGHIFKRALLVSSLLLTSQAFAANGNGIVHFTGEIIDSTCEVSTGTKDQTVDLGKVNKSTFTDVGSTASVQAFQIDLVNCPQTYKKANARFDGTEDGDGYLKLNNGGATGVAIAIYNRADNSLLKLYNQSKTADISAEGTASLPFMARYIATSSTVTAGLANADSEFTITYSN
ncbi:fimbrial protein [Enterobacter cancerogenus]|uniref:fimbrial protein n=1 Tax=Enterobacter cancerogenus TaxID=69218 RepID=UPI000C78123A|nr:fimbrial protein [Enterobacter cancerogenus]AUJ83706.1 fimbrial protein [Enterobacter cancerogenus]